MNLNDLEGEIVKRDAEEPKQVPPIHPGDCTCDGCYLDRELIARMEEEWRQWE